MASFDELWEKSLTFRGLFVGRDRLFESFSRFDKARAKFFWEKRAPQINWGFCKEPGCKSLVKTGEYCEKHLYVSQTFPTWRLVDGFLYRYMADYYGVKPNEYCLYHEHIAEKKYGPIPPGYVVYFQDGNKFNCRKDNLIVLSKIALNAVKSELLSLSDAVAFDACIEEFIHKQQKAGRRPVHAVFGYGDIGRAAGVSLTTLRKAVERKELHPLDLLSITEFVSKRRKKHSDE